MTRDEFFDWAEAQDVRYEYDGLQPVAMTAGNLGHSLITGNIISQLKNRLRGKPCQPVGPDAGVATIGNTVRYPDAVITCKKFNFRDRLVPDPVIVFEVISPSSIRIDRINKLREYQAVPSIRRYLIVEGDAAAVTILSRGHASDPWTAAGLTHDDILPLPEIGIELPISDIYEGITFETPQAE